jgi:hypothetical protein
VFTSRDETIHLGHVHLLPERLVGLVLNLGKCQFGRPLLGHRILEHRVLPLSSHLASILGFTQPMDIKDLQSFLDLVTFYYILSLAQPASSSLSPVCCIGASGGKLTWTEDAAAAFMQAKLTVCNTSLLSHPVAAQGSSPGPSAPQGHMWGHLAAGRGDRLGPPAPSPSSARSWTPPSLRTPTLMGSFWQPSW